MCKPEALTFGVHGVCGREGASIDGGCEEQRWVEDVVGGHHGQEVSGLEAAPAQC